ncbi:MAG: hypothetical protein EOP06_14250 [Proteobacteria bacterium]|nr:MAG: hypothetical protein EOP06_14250 [Pseudomonadota bacterium]
MKYVFSTLILAIGFSASASSLPCDGNLQAKFVAQYRNVNLSYPEAGNPAHTTFGLKDFSYFEANPECALSLDQAVNAEVYVSELLETIHNGASVSGTLNYNSKFKTFSVLQ